jgi:hypothetical protein
MVVSMTHPGGLPKSPGSLTEAQKDTVRVELDRILAGSNFRGSKRSQEFLRYIVTHALEGNSDLLKERIIGIQVFERDADYATGDDSIVRVKANEVRKRLAQHYQESGAAVELQIELPPGSYSPEFRWAHPESPPPVPVTAQKPAPAHRWVLAALPVVLAICAAAGWLWLGRRGGGVLDQFWEPFLRNPRPLLLCIPNPVIYLVRREALPELKKPAGMVPSSAILRDPNGYVGVGDAFAISQFATLLGRVGKPCQLRIWTETSFADLRSSPAILIGAFSNQWTLEITKDLRFTFDREDGDAEVTDQMAPGHRWARTATTPRSDFAIISRVFRSRTGEPVIIAAGLGQYGTQVAGELLTNAIYLEEALHGAPADWQTKNLQIVVRTEVIGATPGPPKTLATHFW